MYLPTLVFVISLASCFVSLYTLIPHMHVNSRFTMYGLSTKEAQESTVLGLAKKKYTILRNQTALGIQSTVFVYNFVNNNLEWGYAPLCIRSCLYVCVHSFIFVYWFT